MDIYLHNTFSGKKELFTPLVPGNISMYNCGPTVYNYVHIGNLRSYVFADTLRRMFEWNGFKVTQVINITDVGHLVSDGDYGEDKMEKGAMREGKTAQEISKFYTESFFDDLEALNISLNDITFPRATAYIAEQIEMILALEKGDYTYKTEDAIYFNTEKFPEYKNLFGIDRSKLNEEFARVTPLASKKNHLDFALWKFSHQEEKRQQEWPSPWGIGFPGWHIECSAMSKKLLGVTFDLHTGGIDHVPVHHTNEIAQSLCANKAPFVHYWMHNAFLTVNEGDKMAKSGENFIRLESLRERNIDPLAYRYLLLTARYSSPLQFSWQALEGAQTARKRLQTFVSKVASDTSMISRMVRKILSIYGEEYKKRFNKYINDDLDFPKAVALVWEVVKDEKITDVEKSQLICDFDTVLGLRLGEKNKNEVVEIPTEILSLVTARDLARTAKDFPQSDQIRDRIESLGFEVKDTEKGTEVKKK